LAVNIRDTRIDGLVVIGIDGELDGSNVALLNKCLSAHLAAGKRRIVIDLQACAFIDSSGLAAILHLVRDVQAGGALAIARPNPNIRRLLEVVGLPGTEGFEVYGDLPTACAATSLHYDSPDASGAENTGLEGQSA
jgi:anti-sigma B factor antagonist